MYAIHYTHTIQTLQTIIISRSKKALPVVGLPEHLSSLPEALDRGTICSGDIDVKCFIKIEKNTMHLNRDCSFSVNSCCEKVYSMSPGTRKNLCDVFAARMAKYRYHMFSDRRIIIIIRDAYNYWVRFVQVCTKINLYTVY